MKMTSRFLAPLILAALLMGCSGLQTTGKVVATPFTVVRDVVDAPFVTIANVFEYGADRTDPVPRPGAGAGWTWRGGFNFGFGVDFSHWFCKGGSWLFGGVDYLVCRSLWPNWPKGISPWLAEGEKWGSLYFPDTRALWREAE